MTKISQLLAVASLLSAAGTGTAYAADITYIGTQKVGPIDATYSITTDGKTGPLESSDITSFDINLQDGSSSMMLNENNAQISGNFSANSSDIFIPNSNTRISFRDSHNTIGNFIGFSNNYTTVYYNSPISSNEQNGTSFATAVPPSTTSAVPEVATWSMMIVGFAAVGFAMRRRQSVSTTVRFA